MLGLTLVRFPECLLGLSDARDADALSADLTYRVRPFQFTVLGQPSILAPFLTSIANYFDGFRQAYHHFNKEPFSNTAALVDPFENVHDPKYSGAEFGSPPYIVEADYCGEHIGVKIVNGPALDACIQVIQHLEIEIAASHASRRCLRQRIAGV